MDSALRFCWFSDQFEEVTGVSPRALLGYSRREMLEQGDPVTDDVTSLADWWNHVAQLEAHEPFRDFVHPRMHPRKGKVYVSISGTPVFDTDGRFAGYRGSGRDATREIMTEKQLMEAKEEAEQANQAKTAFLANMSHELRTPLNAIIGFAELIEQQIAGPIGNERYSEYAADIRQSGRHLLGIISDILDIAKVESRQIELATDVVPLCELVDAAMNNVRPQANRSDVELCPADEAPDVMLRCDERRLSQVLVNLLSNAVKFSDAGGRVTVTAGFADDRFAITVTDTGIGLTPVELELAMQPFGQAANHTTRDHEGTGLGLNIAENLCQLHGGTLELVSTPGEGTSASILLPVDRVLSPRGQS
ncbi:MULTISPECIES: PAS domain-containing sensor histidine kinase [unclassified Minwuia]|uniref:PAS domain-containing sensor histidine kinase n=1 Tax=unclassified Minwuia TaxID=2618799 RepID=UPI00247A99C0|nr:MULTISPECIES: PAS domain-containing sensor histidine kinase [unclassified Minwuia]